MTLPSKIIEILSNYSSCNPGVRKNLANMLMTGALAGTGKMVILPVDQGFEHGPDRSFSKNPDGYDPDYHFKLAIEGKLNAYAAPLGSLETSIDKFAGEIPVILKLNSSNSLSSKDLSPSQAITGSVKDALRLGCSAIGMTIYPGSNNFNDSIKEIKEIISEAKSYGIPSVVWSYPRGEGVSKNGETAIDVISYAAHIACLIGAHIVKVKPPSDFIEQAEAKKAMDGMDISTLSKRIAIVKKSCFDGKRLVIFSGGAVKNEDDIYTEIQEIANGGGCGSIIGRNAFQRNKKDALALLDKIISIYKNS